MYVVKNRDVLGAVVQGVYRQAKHGFRMGKWG